MKQTTKAVQYMEFGKLYKPTEASKIRRAKYYANALYYINNAGVGADDNLSRVREVLYNIKQLCLTETGYEITEKDVDVM
jgi:hypothetical protein